MSKATVFDLFVSYASPDDELPPPHDRWVTRLVDGLRRTLRHQMGRDPVIYFDQNTAEPNQHWAEIDAACRASRLFLAVNSPAYASRDWPRRELELFSECVDDPGRLFVVENTPVNDDRRHPALRERTYKRFFSESAGGARKPMPLEPDTREFARPLWDLAEAMEKQLAAMSDVRPTPSANAALGPVLLAVPTDDLEEERDSVRRHLEQFGIEVLPHAEYPLGGPAFRDAFLADVRRSKLVVQLLGPHPGRRPPDLPEGYVQHQYDAATAAGVPIMQWRSAALTLERVRDAAHRNLLAGEVVTATTLEQFKRDIRHRLEPPPAPPMAETGGKSTMIIFINAEKADAHIAQQLQEALAQDYSVMLPLYDVEGSSQKDIRRKLELCQALLVVYGKAGAGWIDDTMYHTLKIRSKCNLGMPFGAVCLGPPPHKPHVSFRIPGIRELDCTSPSGDEWRLEPVKELMAKLPC